MKQEKLKFSEFTLGHFQENDEIRKIKDYAKQLKQLEDFKHLNLFFVHYNDSDTYKQKIKLANLPQTAKRQIISLGTSILPYAGMYNVNSKEIMIFIDNQIKFGKLEHIVVHLSKFKIDLIKNPNSFKRTCCSILKTMYHEKKHHLQNTNTDNSFSSIMYQIEKNLKISLYGTIKYILQHDKWYFEIDANNYGVKKALEHYKKNPTDDNVDWDYLERLEKKYEYNQITYNFDAFFTTYNIYREKIPFINNVRNQLSNIFLKDKNSLWHQVLYGDKKRLNSIDQILNHPSFKEVNEEFMNMVLTSRYLNKNINYDNLDYNSLNILKIQFENRLAKTSMIVNKLLSEQDELIIHRMKKELERLKEDIKYYESMITLINSRILNVNNQQNTNHKKQN